jgi:exonuclease SbcD
MILPWSNILIRFIHTADIHFGVENYGRIDQTTGIHTRLLDFYRALGICIDRAIKEKVDFFLFAGDAYKTAHPTPTQQRLLFMSFLRLFRAKIPIVMVIGNHDYALSFGKAHALDMFGQIPVQGFHVIAKPLTVQLATQSGPVNIVGIPWPSRSSIPLQGAYAYASGSQLADYMSKSVAEIIAQQAAMLDSAIPAVLAGHLTVNSGIFSGSEKRAIYGKDPLFDVDQLAIKPFDYVALGHLHRYQNLNEHGYPAVVYSGSVERVDFGERSEIKGFCIVTIHEKNKTTHEFIPIPTRPFVQVAVHLSDERNQTEQIIAALEEQDITDAIVKIIYHIPAGARDRVDRMALQTACAAAHGIASIIPVRIIAQLKPRCERISADMDMQTLIKTYLTAKPELLPYEDRLLKKLALLSEET